MRYFLYTALMFIGLACANVGSPDGGPKDEEPPFVVKSDPRMNALNFDGEKVEITFNELIVLKELNKNFVVSPPLLKEPVVKALGKVLSIELNNELQPNTTYTLYFGNAIADNNEGNVLANYAFSFSTGAEIDTMVVSGFLFNASDLNPSPNVIVGLYRNLHDSAFTNDVPVRIARTNDKGRFVVRNIGPGSYKIRGLKEMVSNFKFDQPGEEIAFSDTIFKPFQTLVAWPDTVFRDSVTVDSIVFRDTLLYKPDSLLLLSFVEKNMQQRFIKKDRPKPYQMGFYFSNNIGEQMSLRFTDSLANRPFYYNPTVTGDTMLVWITDSAVYKCDSLELICRYQATDSLLRLQWREDTLQLNYRRPKASDKKSKDAKPAVQPVYEIKDLIGAAVPPGENIFALLLAEPLKQADMSSLRLFVATDTLKKPLPLKIAGDTLYSTEIKLSANLKPGLSYKIELDSAALVSLYDLCSDKITKTISVKKNSDYCSIKFAIKNLTENAVLELLNSSDKPIRSIVVTPGKPVVTFTLLDPGSYFARVVIDKNKNGVWDTGNYKKQIQPESVFYFGKGFETRGNWSYEEIWDITATPVFDQKPAKLVKSDSKSEN